MEYRNTMWSRVKGAITDFSSYKLAYEQTLGAAIKYLFLLCLILATIASFVSMVRWNNTVNFLQAQYLTNIPTVTVEKGVLDIDAPMPIVYEDTSLFLYIDVDQVLDSSLSDDHSTAIIIDKNNIYVKSETKVQSFPIKDIGDMVVTGDDVERFINKTNIFIDIAIIVFGVLFCFIGKLISMLLVMGLVGLIASKIAGLKLRYEDCCKLGAYALTVPIIIKLTLVIIDVTIPWFWVGYYGIGIVYLIKAGKKIEEMKEIENTLENTVYHGDGFKF